VDNVKLPEIILNWLTLPLLLAVSTLASTAQADVVVIVSAKSHITSLTVEQTAKIFLGKTSNFPDDGDALPIDQAEGSAIRDEFYSKVVRKNSSQLSAYWARVIFTGDGRPPAILESSVAVRKAVAKNPNAIGYVDKSAVDKSVRIILAP
jgi:ABC-type phosphate transport system substrate-binding protein